MPSGTFSTHEEANLCSVRVAEKAHQSVANSAWCAVRLCRIYPRNLRQRLGHNQSGEEQFFCSYRPGNCAGRLDEDRAGLYYDGQLQSKLDKPASSTPVGIGSQGWLSSGAPKIPVVMVKAIAEEWTRAQVANDTIGQADLLRSAEFFRWLTIPRSWWSTESSQGVKCVSWKASSTVAPAGCLQSE
jgi:hypothetical protein